MPFDYSRFLQAVDSRARRLHGLSIAAVSMTGGAFTSLVGMLTVRLLRVPLPYWSLATLLVPPILGAAIGYAVGRSRTPRIPSLLLRIDDALGLNARLSSLYELRQRSTVSIFRRRLEGEVRDALGSWRTAVPVPPRTVLGGGAGLCCLALAVGLAFVPLPAPAPSPLDLVDDGSAASRAPVSDAERSPSASSTEGIAPVALEIDTQGSEAGGMPSLDAPADEQTLENVLRDLSGRSPENAVLVPVSLEEIEELARIQGEAIRAAAELLEDIRDRLEASPPSDPRELTEAELEALQRQLDRGGLPPEVQQGLNELMNRPASRSVEEIVEDLLDQFGDEPESETSSQGGTSGQPQTTAVTPDQQEIEDLLDELGQAASDSEQSSGPGDEPGGGEGPSQDGDGTASTLTPSTEPGERAIEDPDPFGGTEGSGGPSSQEEEREAGFIREEQRGRVGSEGDFLSEFVTEGVPIERTPGSDEADGSLRISYERLASILRERGLPDGAIELVREYFEAITEGGS